MDRTELQRRCEALPIFPLPRLVMMPRDVLPLHVFEPRYRALVAHCMAGDRVLAMATLEPGADATTDPRPPIHPELAVGVILRHQALPDGRSNIVLQWLARASLVSETEGSTPFRVVRARVRDDVDDMGLRLPQLRALVVQIGSYSEAAAAEALRLADLDPVAMVDEIARRMLEGPDDRRRYVQLDRLSDRAALLEQRLADLIVGGRAPIGDA
jgi:Lon protease-like protein